MSELCQRADLKWTKRAAGEGNGYSGRERRARALGGDETEGGRPLRPCSTVRLVLTRSSRRGVRKRGERAGSRSETKVQGERGAFVVDISNTVLVLYTRV